VPTEKRQRQKEGQQARREAALAAAKRQQRKRQRIFMAVAVVVIFAVIGIAKLTGGGDGKKTNVSSTGKASTTTTSAATSPPTSAKPGPVAAGGAAPVTKLGIEDIKVGTGATVKAGDTIVAHYLGATYKDGKQFESSWDSGHTFEAKIGVGKVIKGWDQGIPGMKVGGRRKLTIPADLAYGSTDDGSGRPFGDLVFIVDVYAIK
jgi:peptidylprolyl isomerase